MGLDITDATRRPVLDSIGHNAPTLLPSNVNRQKKEPASSQVWGAGHHHKQRGRKRANQNTELTPCKGCTVPLAPGVGSQAAYSRQPHHLSKSTTAPSIPRKHLSVKEPLAATRPPVTTTQALAHHPRESTHALPGATKDGNDCRREPVAARRVHSQSSGGHGFCRRVRGRDRGNDAILAQLVAGPCGIPAQPICHFVPEVL